MKWKLLRATLALVMVVGLTNAVTPAADGKVRVIILDGQNNHDWKATTPVLVKILESAGKFDVKVVTAPTNPKTPAKPKDENDPVAQEKYKAALEKFKEEDAKYKTAMAAFRPDFSQCDVIVSNYNGAPWPEVVNKDLEERLKEGKIGLVIVHAANNSFGGWKEYNQMIGMGWRDKNYGDRLKFDENGKEIRVSKGEGDASGHRYTGKFAVTIRDAEHPVTKGMPHEWMHNNDELYDNMRGPIQHVHMLATAVAPMGKGTGVHEPMIWTVDYGKGRVFHTPMGHDVNSMKCVGFAATVQRGTEWAATGKVTIPLPKDFPTEKEVSVTK
jgi:type 1 glutamine amidotransferase